MKSVAVLCLVIALASSMTVKSSFQLSMENQIHAMKKTGWGKVAAGLMELQIKTGGPMSELVTAFKNLIRDLNFKLNSEHQEYRWAKAEHFEFVKEWEEKLTDAKFRFAVAKNHLKNTLYPERARLQKLIDIDVALVKKTQADLAQASSDRKAAQGQYEKNCAESDSTLDAVQECIRLLRGLKRGGASFAEISRTQAHVRKFARQLQTSTAWGHLAKALVDLAQNFANKGAVNKVLKLFTSLESNLGSSREDMDAQNANEITIFKEFVAVCTGTINKAEARLAGNRAELAVVQASIDHQEELRDTAKTDRDLAAKTLKEEDERWTAAVQSYEDYIQELKEELNAIDRVLDVFAKADVDDHMLERIDW